MRPNLSRAFRGERGVTLVTFALSLVAICAVIALVIGGSIGYSSERNSQTASDAAALAGANKLRAFQLDPVNVSYTEVDATAVSVAEDNGADAGQVVCRIVAPEFAVDPTDPSNDLGPCSSLASVTHPSAAGVWASTQETKDVPFGEVAGSPSITAGTGAAATIQPLATGSGPFLLCSSTAPDGHTVKVLEDDPGPDGIYDPNPLAIYNAVVDAPYFVMWGNDVKHGKRQCNDDGVDDTSDEGWRGLADGESSSTAPGYFGIDTGNRTGTIGRLLASPDACDLTGNPQISDLDDWCEIIVPLCISDNGLSGTSKELYCVNFGRFEIRYFGSPSAAPASGAAPCQALPHDDANQVICGRFLGGGSATVGEGVVGVAGPDDIVVIKLVQ